MTTYQACRDFVFAGTQYVRGDAFVHARPAIQIGGLLRARMIKKVQAVPASIAPQTSERPKRKRRKG